MRLKPLRLNEPEPLIPEKIGSGFSFLCAASAQRDQFKAGRFHSAPRFWRRNNSAVSIDNSDTQKLCLLKLHSI